MGSQRQFPITGTTANRLNAALERTRGIVQMRSIKPRGMGDSRVLGDNDGKGIQLELNRIAEKRRGSRD